MGVPFVHKAADFLNIDSISVLQFCPETDQPDDFLPL